MSVLGGGACSERAVNAEAVAGSAPENVTGTMIWQAAEKFSP
jgi:hypothetical protein